jgi:hypothetical protein
MSLLRLLTTGKSLVGLKDTESRYRLTRQRLLPQFGRARNPFTSRGSPATAQVEAPAPEDLGANNPTEQSLGNPSPCCKAAPRLPSLTQNWATSTSASGRGFAEALLRRALALLSGWRTKVISLSWRRSGKTERPAVQRLTKQAVQGELSLERIKVLRNDLSDADLEVVPAKEPVAPASAAPAVQTEVAARCRERTWRRVTTRMFGAGKT